MKASSVITRDRATVAQQSRTVLSVMTFFTMLVHLRILMAASLARTSVSDVSLAKMASRSRIEHRRSTLEAASHLCPASISKVSAERFDLSSKMSFKCSGSGLFSLIRILLSSFTTSSNLFSLYMVLLLFTVESITVSLHTVSIVSREMQFSCLHHGKIVSPSPSLAASSDPSPFPSSPERKVLSVWKCSWFRWSFTSRRKRLWFQ
mmetsp:Transcript_3495/g.7867  ORF Transcript_3495/g.7867 Transcript_3495/m.7867 type:complete len:206 (-) Transcript_3495:1071-1688(-)